MKLSKTQLKHFIGGNVACDWNCDPYKEITNEQFKSRVLHSLHDGTLEIEGYEKSGWIKYDPNNPDTFPPINEQIIVYYDKDLIDEDYEIGFAVFMTEVLPPWVTYWKHGPKPPTKQ